MDIVRGRSKIATQYGIVTASQPLAARACVQGRDGPCGAAYERACGDRAHRRDCSGRLIERIITVARAFGREIASSADARRMLGRGSSGEAV